MDRAGRELLDRAANAVWDADLESAKGRQPWATRPEVVKAHYRKLALAALSAAHCEDCLGRVVPDSSARERGDG